MYSEEMIEPQIRVAEPKEAASFLDQGDGVDQAHLRNALSNALERIADLTERVSRLEGRRRSERIIDELED